MRDYEKEPHELMSKSYCGPAKVVPLGQVPNEDGFRFIGIDRNGGAHYCIVRKGDSNSYYMGSNTALFSDLIGWIPDTQAPNAPHEGPGAASSRTVPLDAVVGRHDQKGMG